MRPRLVRVAKLLAYPAFYLFSLALFGYLTFPYGRLRDRVIAEIEKHGKPGQRVEIAKLGPYWFSGVEVSGVKLHLPPDEAQPAGFPGSADFGAAAAPAKESVITVDEAHARVRLLPLLIGRVRLDFWASAFGGEIKGSAPVGGKGEVEVELDHVDISKIEPIGQAIGVPLRGVATGKLTLDAPDGKFNKASGALDLTLADVIVSDGKTKIQGLIELPPAKLGDLVIAAEAKEGSLKITKLSANGTDLDIVGDGKITLREPWSEAVADLYLRFKFTDGYRGKNGTTKSLLGDPGSNVPGLMEMQVPKMKRAKRSDGFYGWHVFGPLKRLRFDPSTTDGAGASTTTGGAPPSRRLVGKGTDSPFPRRPLGGAAAHDTAEPPSVPTPPPPPPPDRGHEPPARDQQVPPTPPPQMAPPPPVPPPPPPPPAHEPSPPPPHDQPENAPPPEAPPP